MVASTAEESTLGVCWQPSLTGCLKGVSLDRYGELQMGFPRALVLQEGALSRIVTCGPASYQASCRHDESRKDGDRRTRGTSCEELVCKGCSFVSIKAPVVIAWLAASCFAAAALVLFEFAVIRSREYGFDGLNRSTKLPASSIAKVQRDDTRTESGNRESQKQGQRLNAATLTGVLITGY